MKRKKPEEEKTIFEMSTKEQIAFYKKAGYDHVGVDARTGIVTKVWKSEDKKRKLPPV